MIAGVGNGLLDDAKGLLEYGESLGTDFSGTMSSTVNGFMALTHNPLDSINDAKDSAVEAYTDSVINADLALREGDFYGSGVEAGSVVAPVLEVVAGAGVVKVATSVVKVGEVDNTTTSNSTGNNESYEAEGDFDGNNPSDSIYEEASGQAKLDVLVSQLPEIEDISGEFTLDNSLSDQEFYNRLLQSENIDISKPENKGRKGAIKELIRDVMSNITDDVDITK